MSVTLVTAATVRYVCHIKRWAHQEAVDVRAGGERGGVLGVGGAAVLDADHVGAKLGDVGGDPLADVGVRVLRLLRRRDKARANGPDRLVGDDDCLRVEEMLHLRAWAGRAVEAGAGGSGRYVAGREDGGHERKDVVWGARSGGGRSAAWVAGRRR